jgi:hypothetical protein
MNTFVYRKEKPDFHKQGFPRIIPANGQVNRHKYLCHKKAPAVKLGLQKLKLTY